MFDIQHDSPVPIHEQLISQIRTHVASGALKAGAVLAEYRAFAQELLTNPQVVARAYADLEAEGVLARTAGGGMAVSGGADAICMEWLRNTASEQIRRAIALGVVCGLDDAEIAATVASALADSKARALSPHEILQAIKKPTHESSHRTSQGIQDLSRESRPGLS
jgi:DNA-binding transcriptional regulator YhcF (GntR family)